jgi:hypothetical protein
MPSWLHRNNFSLDSHIFWVFCVHTLNIMQPNKIWCSYNHYHTPTQNLVFLQSTLRTHTKFGVLTINTTHPHKIWCSCTQNYAPTQNSCNICLFIWSSALYTLLNNPTTSTSIVVTKYKAHSFVFRVISPFILVVSYQPVEETRYLSLLGVSH